MLITYLTDSSQCHIDLNSIFKENLAICRKPLKYSQSVNVIYRKKTFKELIKDKQVKLPTRGN